MKLNMTVFSRMYLDGVRNNTIRRIMEVKMKVKSESKRVKKS